MRFCSLGSGSSGNATVVEAHSDTTTSRLLIDCGFSLRELGLRLTRAGLTPADLTAVFITHEHGDHVGCAMALARRHRLPLWMSRGTWHAIGEPDADGLLNFARDGQPIIVGDLMLNPFTVTHDAQEPLQLDVTDGASKLGVLTDVGSVTPHLLARLQGCNAMLLECNHDRELLAGSRYHASLKARISGRLGHLSNDTAAQILAACLHPGLNQLVAAHLSKENNRPELARQALAKAGGRAASDIVVADPLLGSDWLSVG